MTRPTPVNCRSHRQFQGAKDADRLQPKWRCSRLLFRGQSTRTPRLPVEKAGTNSFVSLDSNMVSLTPRLNKAGRSARRAVGMAGIGCWRKRTPLGNRADRSNALPRKRAEFQRVIGNERTGKTFKGGNSK